MLTTIHQPLHPDALMTRLRARPADTAPQAPRTRKAAKPSRSGATAGVHYTVLPADPAGHIFEIGLHIEAPAPEGQLLALPAWIPGSYMIREFARHVISVAASSGRRTVALRKLDKHTWQAAPVRGPLELRYKVYAWDLSVRAAHFDQTHAFFNGTSLFLRVLGQEDAPCTVDLLPPADPSLADWQVATTLPRHGARPWGFGRHRAGNYDELVDHPVEMGRFSRAGFEACGVPHDIVITGRHDADLPRLCADLKRICEAQIRLFEPRKAEAPFERYLFLTMAVGDGYGGLEHRSSTALICQRNDLPAPGQTGTSDAYTTFLGLCSHEYFHSWNVKRIKPAAFVPYDLNSENYTRLLWLFEGFTSYYDDLILRRAGLIDPEAYLKLVATTISGVQRGPGRKVQSVADSSFDTWIKYYRQDENTPNAVVSYYTKGSLVALCIDLVVRDRTKGRRSLDDVMRELWRRFGRDFDRHPRGLGEEEIASLIETATGVDLRTELARWVDGTSELPLAEALAGVGVRLTWQAADPTPWLGVRMATRQGDLTLTTVLTGGPAHSAGLSAGDVLVAVDGLRMNDAALKGFLKRRRSGQTVEIHAFRRDELMNFSLRLAAPPATEASLAAPETGPAARRRLRRGWLGR